MERRDFLAASALGSLALSCQSTAKNDPPATGDSSANPNNPKPNPVINPQGTRTRLWGPGGDKYEFLITGEQTGNSTFALHANVPPGGGPPPHIHTRENESYYIESGELQFTLGNETKTVKAGDFVFIPKGTVHTFTNKGNEIASMMVTFVPSGMEGWFKEVLVPVKDDTEKPVDYTQQQLDFMIEAGPRHGVEWRLPNPKA